MSLNLNWENALFLRGIATVLNFYVTSNRNLRACLVLKSVQYQCLFCVVFRVHRLCFSSINSLAYLLAIENFLICIHLIHRRLTLS